MTSLIEHLVDLLRDNPDALDPMDVSELRELLPLGRRNWYSSSGEMKAAILSACASHLKEQDFSAALAMVGKAASLSDDEAIFEKVCSFLTQAGRLEEALDRYSGIASRSQTLALKLISCLRQANRLDEALEWCIKIAGHLDVCDSKFPYTTQYRLAEIRHQMSLIFSKKGEDALYLYCRLDEWWRQRVGNALSGRLLPIDSDDLTLFLSGQKTKKALAQFGDLRTESVVSSLIIAIEPYASKLMRLSDISLPLVDVKDPENPGNYVVTNQSNTANPEYMDLLQIVASPEVTQKVFQLVFAPFFVSPPALEAYSFG